jgi:glutathione S-transferase
LLTLNESGLPFTIDEVSLTDNPAHFTALYARALGRDAASTGKVPILQDGAFILTESLAICEYVAAKAGGSLLAATPEERARAALFADLVAKIGPSCFALLRVPKGGAEAAAAAAALTEALGAVSDALALCGGPFLLGERWAAKRMARGASAAKVTWALPCHVAGGQPARRAPAAFGRAARRAARCPACGARGQRFPPPRRRRPPCAPCACSTCS